MPWADASARGYQDGQRIQNWDSAELYGHASQLQVAPEATPLLDVSRWAYLGGFDFSSDQAFSVQLTWFDDPAGANAIGTRTFVLSTLIDAAQYRLPNLGPFVQITWTGVSAANFHHAVRLIGTNRAHPLEFIPQNPVLLDLQAQNVNAGATVTLLPSDYYAGPAQVWSEIGQASIVWAEYLTTANTWHQISQELVAAATNSIVPWVFPPGAWRINVKNTGAAAGSLFLAVTPSTTGAS